MISQTLQFPSMLAKVVHCDLHDHAVEGRTLDAALNLFKEKYCNTCKDIAPRPADWNYSDEWQEEENRRHLDFMAKFRRKRQGI